MVVRNIPFWKRALDLSLIAATAPITIPVAVGICAYIKLVSGGPVLFKQQRVGIGASKFTCFKFRSMKVNAPTQSHQTHFKDVIEKDSPMEKIDKKDDRLIPGARFLRATGLDELPQLINVIKGEMSLVGPRPCLTYEYDYFAKSHKRRFEVLPGLTGLWQINGKNKTTFRKMVQFDLAYAKHHNILMDIGIMIATIKPVLSQFLETFEIFQLTSGKTDGKVET